MLPDFSDLLVVLIPMLAVLAGIGVGLRVAVLQEEAQQKADEDFAAVEHDEHEAPSKSTKQLI